MASPSRNSSKMLSPKHQRISDEALCLQMQQFLDNWHYIVMKSSLGKTLDRRKVLEMALHVLSMNGIRFTAEEINELIQTEEEVMIYEVVDRMPEGLRDGFEHLTLELLVVVTTAARMRTTVEQDESDPIQAVMEEEGATAFGQQTLKRAILQASKEAAKTIRCKETWGPNMAKRLDRLNRSTEIAEESNKRLLVVEAALNALPGARSAKAIHALTGFIGSSKEILLQSAWAGWLGATLRSKGERNLSSRYEQEVQAAEDELELFKARHLKNIRGIVEQNYQRENQDLMSTIMADWRSQTTRQKAEAWTDDHVNNIHLTISRAAKEMCGRAKKVIGRMLHDQEGASVGACFSSWVIFSTAYKKEKEFEEHVKNFEKQMKVFRDKKKDDAAIILNRISAATDSGLVQQTLAAWTTYTFDGQKLRRLEGKVFNCDDQLSEVKKYHRRIALDLSGRTGDQIDMNTMYQAWMCWTSLTRTDRLDKYYSGKIESKRKQLSSVQVLFQSFADELESGLGIKEQEDDSGGASKAANGRGIAKSDAVYAMAGAVSLPDIHAKKGSQ